MSADIPQPRGKGLTRRGMLAAMGITAGAAAVSPLAARAAFAADPGYTGDVLVVLSMHGGWDTLSVIPPSPQTGRTPRLLVTGGRCPVTHSSRR